MGFSTYRYIDWIIWSYFQINTELYISMKEQKIKEFIKKHCGTVYVAQDENDDFDRPTGLMKITKEKFTKDLLSLFDNWISVEDELPEVGQTVLICERKFIDVSYRLYDNIWKIGEFPRKDWVTHWQPLLELPKSKQ